MSQAAAMARLLEAQFNHLVLPAGVPSKRDANLPQIESTLTDRLLNACRFLRESASDNSYFEWDNIRRILLAAKTVNFDGRIEKLALIQELRRLEEDGFLILHIAEQNAGLLVRRLYSDHGPEVVFEAFEASPRSKDALAAEAVLQWDFPGGLVAVPYDTFANDDFQDSLAGFLQQCSTESIKRFAARTGKANSFVIEPRDTADPAMISSLLMTILEAHGRRLSMPLLRKRVRDSVCWADGAELPWRRLPYWLVLRVGLARCLANKHGGEIGRLRYKLLMCVTLAQLLGDALGVLTPQDITILKAKLARRLAKLEMAKARASPDARIQYDAVFTTLGPTFQKTLQEANHHVISAWDALKTSITQPIRPLPRYANPAHLTLTLPNSGHILHSILDNPRVGYHARTRSSKFNMGAANQNMREMTRSCFSLAQFELDVEHGHTVDGSLSLSDGCIEAHQKINDYLELVSTAYNGNPEQKSVMILTVMELWVTLDQAATNLFGLLLAFSPGIPPEALDVLQLPRFSDMQRLQKVQNWLHFRQQKSKFTENTIFDGPYTGCFAERFYEESDMGALHELYERIEDAANQARAEKEEELEALSEYYESLQRCIAEMSCVEVNKGLYKEHVKNKCPKCMLSGEIVRIELHEHFLPKEPVYAKAVVFELACPPEFAAYRNATWKILGTLARPPPTDLKVKHQKRPLALLHQYPSLAPFMIPHQGGLTLGSRTKTFEGSHFRSVHLPVRPDDVCKENSLRLGYFDSLSSSWTGSTREKPTFVHHCQVIIPLKSLFSHLQSQPQFAADAGGPQSNEVIASQTRCPPGLNSHEYMAFQSLFSGNYRRWPFLLVELASSNLNFSTEATSLLVSQLSSQAGPADGSDPLRIVHCIFRDESFCEELLEQIRTRLETILANWRETNSMGMLISLLLRMVALSRQESGQSALKLLDQIRRTTYDWICQSRSEIHKATDSESSCRCSRYALWAALLCRRTFSPYCEDDYQTVHDGLSSTDLQYFVESSITLQDNMVSNPTALPAVLRHALMRDLKTTYRLRFLLRQSILEDPSGLIHAINNIWSSSPGSSFRTCSDVQFLDDPHDWVLQLTFVGGKQSNQQVVHYHILEGHLLIDNKPLGRLPKKHRNSTVLIELFGQDNMPIYPSDLYGMSYKLAFPEKHHEFHLGFRDDGEEELVIRARNWDPDFGERIIEHIPRTAFVKDGVYDLPAYMVDNCVHWLDVTNAILDIRPMSEKWKYKSSNWRIDMRTHIASRRQSRLVDPHSTLFRQVSDILQRFESPHLMTVFQPPKGALSVELRRLELTFHVDPRRNLFCRELRAEVDPNQDAGTWYGLSSKLILRDPLNLQNRSIIVPLGPLSCQRNKFHVAVKVQPNGQYARYTINTVLGRLDCPAEPWLLFFKAQLHAFTSAILPDPLTGRTGTEEALHLLRSGTCQPWAPLPPGALSCLVSIADLTPAREYYPEGMKQMERVRWNSRLTVTIQRDEYLPLVQSIFQKSSELLDFFGSNDEQPQIRELDMHLVRRSIYHRQLYERTSDESEGRLHPSDLAYMSRDRPALTTARRNVFESVKLLTRWSPNLPMPLELGAILNQWPLIQGHGQTFDKILLSDHLDLQFGPNWGSLLDFCRQAKHDQVYRLGFMFGALSFGSNVDMGIVHTLIAFTISEQLKSLEPPKWPSYSDFRQGHIPTVAQLERLAKAFRVPYPGDFRSQMNVNFSGKMRRRLQMQQQAHEEKAENDCHDLASFLLTQWPCEEPTLEGLSLASPLLVDMSQAFQLIKDEWLRLFQNFELSQYISQVQEVLNHYHASPILPPMEIPFNEERVLFLGNRGDEVPSLSRDLLRKPGRVLPKEMLNGSAASPQNASCSLKTSRPFRADKENFPTGTKPLRQSDKFSQRNTEVSELEQIVGDLSLSKSTVRQHYSRDLKQSINSLKLLANEDKRPSDANLPIELTVATSEARQRVQYHLNAILQSLERHDPRAKWLNMGGLWPCTTTVALLEQIRSISTTVFGSGMKESLVEFAVSITHLQRMLRLYDASLKDAQKLKEEQAYPGHTNWEPASNTDWLLLEVDSNILIRPGQIDVALATISPDSGANSVLQMNMGQGKTSCIIPMVAASLADTKRLVRIIVPNALLLQTAQLLHGRLGGLLGRQLRHIPFSRKTSTTQSTSKTFYHIHKAIMRDAGIIIALPEHIMSFMLSGLQRLSDNRVPEATPMVRIQAWMRKYCRDVLDESDFTLAVRTQLIYPSGQQTSVDGHPDRWETAEALLSLVETHIWKLHQDFPQSIEVVRRSSGGFPLFFLLRKDVEDALITRIVEDITRGKTSVLPCQEWAFGDRQVIRKYLTDAIVDPGALDRIQSLFTDTPVVWQNLHHLRGLLVHRILLLTFKKRWSVQYGLHPSRYPIAVPYHAKGVPSEQAEWGHPDVAILFTCLSFYYQGLSLSQLRHCFEHVVKSDDPSSEYDRWMHSGPSIPGSLRDWNVINVDDESQLYELWQHLRYSVVTVNYYLNHFVFPVHAKQFKIKMQSSGWDIPLVALTPHQDGKSSYHKPFTTGFSGTNDNRTLLPLTIKQQDLAGLSHTNAEVITYLLQQRNRGYTLAADCGKRISEEKFLEMLFKRKIRVFIDAGAQILEMDNFTLAKSWLRIDHEAKAALYFQGNRPLILYKNGTKVPLLASPFADDLSQCLVYLDEAHTRGTDLKMPSHATGALTLGLGQTKDHTVQAAMRLRQLATTQSVQFFATPEVHQSIMDQRQMHRLGRPVDSHDVVWWLLEQTCAGLEQLQPLYYSQGVDFCRRSQALMVNPDILTDTSQRGSCLKALRQVEHQTLEQMYMPKKKIRIANASSSFSKPLAPFVKDLNKRRKAFQDDGRAVHASALQEVEQEREVAHEVESVREVQKPVYFSPLRYGSLHRDIISFARTGKLAAGSFAYEHMFFHLRNTALGEKHRINGEIINSQLFVSKEFASTAVSMSGKNDNFLRQVNWVLWSTKTETAIVVVPEEVEELIPLLRGVKNPVTHLLTYAAPVTRKMAHFNDMTFYSIPPMPRKWKAPEWLRIELGLFAGRLYFDFDEYAGMRKYLGLPEDEEEDLVDGFNILTLPTYEDGSENGEPSGSGGGGERRVEKKKAAAFTKKPLTFIREWLACRRKGQDFTHTPMGFVCQGRPLAANHPFFAEIVEEPAPPAALGQSVNGVGHVGSGGGVVEDDEDDFDDAEEDFWFDAKEDGVAEDGREEDEDDVAH